MTRIKNILGAVGFTAAALALCSCNPAPVCNPPNGVIVKIVNDKPGSTARIDFYWDGQHGIVQPVIDGNGKASALDCTVNPFPVTINVTCGNGLYSVLNIFANSLSIPTVTADCRTNAVVTTPASCNSVYNSARMIHRGDNPVNDSTCTRYPRDFSIQSNRMLLLRDFAAQTSTHQAVSNGMYSWLLKASPPDNVVVQNLDAGATLESQAAYIVGGSQFFANSNNDNSTFINKVYNALYLRNPSSGELNGDLHALNGYWFQRTCSPAPPLPSGCNYLGMGHCNCWYQQSRSNYASGMLATNEFHQVASKILVYGIQLRRIPTATEVQNLASYMDTTGSFQEGSLSIASSDEFYQKSTRPW